MAEGLCLPSLRSLGAFSESVARVWSLCGFGSYSVVEFLCLHVSCSTWTGEQSMAIHTKVQTTSSTRVYAEGRVAGWTFLRLELFDVFVKAGFVGDVGAGHLQDAFAPQGVLHWLLTYCTFAPHERPLSSRRPGSCYVNHGGGLVCERSSRFRPLGSRPGKKVT